MYIFVDNSSTIIQHAQDGTPTSVPTGQTTYQIDNSLTGASNLYGSPTWYKYDSVNKKLIRRQYFTLAYDTANQFVNVTLNAGDETPTMTNCTATVEGKVYNVSLAGSPLYGKFAISVHPSVATQYIKVSVTGSDAVEGDYNLGVQDNVVGLQVCTLNGVDTVCPSGVGSKAFLSAYYALSPAKITSLLADIGTAVNLLLDTMYNVVIPQLKSPTYVQFVPDNDQANTINDINTYLVPYIYTTLKNAFPSGGTKQLQYSDMVTDLEKTYNAYESYSQDLLNIPNLS